MKGGFTLIKGAAAPAVAYLLSDVSAIESYYRDEADGVVARYSATNGAPELPGSGEVTTETPMDAEAFTRWVGGFDPDTGKPRGRILKTEKAVRFMDTAVNAPKSWSLAAAREAEIAEAFDAALDRAAEACIGWLAEHSVTRVKVGSRQVDTPVQGIEAATVRHHTSRAGDPHRHLHLVLSSRVRAVGSWYGLHTVATYRMTAAVNGIGHAAMMSDPRLRRVLAKHGYSLDFSTGEIEQLADYVADFSRRGRQIERNMIRLEADWRATYPGEEPTPHLRRQWDKRAWDIERPKKVPRNIEDLNVEWNQRLDALGCPRRREAIEVTETTLDSLDHEAVVEGTLARLGARSSGFSKAKVRGAVSQMIAESGLTCTPEELTHLGEKLYARALGRCCLLTATKATGDYIDAWTTPQILADEMRLITMIQDRAADGRDLENPDLDPNIVAGLDATQIQAVRAFTSNARLVLLLGPAGAGKTKVLSATQRAFNADGNRHLLAVSPTNKAAEVIADEIGSASSTLHLLLFQHGYTLGADGCWTKDRQPSRGRQRIDPGSLILVDEASFMTQSTAIAVLDLADCFGARVAFVGDTAQLPAVGIGGVLEHATNFAPDNVINLQNVYRFEETAYGALTKRMRSGESPGDVFDTLVDMGRISLYSSPAERLVALAEVAAADTTQRVIADSNAECDQLNALIHDKRIERSGGVIADTVNTRRGEEIAVGDRVATRDTNRDLRVANRQTWRVTAIQPDGGVDLVDKNKLRHVPHWYAREHLQLAFATTGNGAQGSTYRHGNYLFGSTSTGRSTYVAMSRGSVFSTAHIVAEDLADAREQWILAFTRDRADLGPAHAAKIAEDELEQYPQTLNETDGELDAPTAAEHLAEYEGRLREADRQHERDQALVPPPAEAIPRWLTDEHGNIVVNDEGDPIPYEDPEWGQFGEPLNYAALLAEDRREAIWAAKRTGYDDHEFIATSPPGLSSDLAQEQAVNAQPPSTLIRYPGR